MDACIIFILITDPAVSPQTSQSPDMFENECSADNIFENESSTDEFEVSSFNYMLEVDFRGSSHIEC
jgi:hypothetical protein